MQSATISYQSSSIHFLHAGHGKKIIICFHGYGETGDSYDFLMKYLPPEEYTIVAPDLPFHGQTEWRDSLDFYPADLEKIISQMIFSIAPTHEMGKSLTTIMGFSLGGRMALSLYELLSDKIDRIILLAPDGLKMNFWYWLPTQTYLGNRFFSFTMKHPYWFLGFLKLLNKLKLINASIFKFVNYYIDDEEVRIKLYQRWTCLRKIRPDIRNIKFKIKQHKTPLTLIYGKHDRIIKFERAEKFIKGIEEYCKLSVIHSGHQVLHEKHVGEILPSLKN